jgi:4-carboxymuconolactone decarboxylase
MPDDAGRSGGGRVAALSGSIVELIRVAAAIAGLDEQSLRQVMETAAPRTDPALMEEVILQSYLFAGFPRALNAARIWRSLVGPPSASAAAESGGVTEWRARGEKTCRVVYGGAYERLRENIRELHPLLDEWMIVDGYGKVLSRPGLDLQTRELCIIAACAASGQQRQLHSHLRGALNAGAPIEAVESALDCLTDIVPADRLASYKLLFARVGDSSARRATAADSAGPVRPADVH